MLQKEFNALVLKYTNDQRLALNLWSDIESAYTGGERHFHTLAHLEQMIISLADTQSLIEDWDSILMAVFYHDIVYDATRYMTENNNEEKSAEAAEFALQQINYPTEKIERVKHHILASKSHELNEDGDTNFFTDADLSILGRPWDIYESYMKNIRKEYEVYPDKIYNSGRTKFLQSLLQRERLFKTDYFFHLFESVAEENMSRELEIVSFS